MKRIFVLMLSTLLLCTALAPSVLAAEEPSVSADTIVDADSGSGTDSDRSSAPATPSDVETKDPVVPEVFDYTGSVISYTTPDAFTGTFDMVCGDTGFTQLHHKLDSVSISGTAEKEGSSYPLTLPVTWDFSTVDAKTPGNYTAIGSISVPEGATLADSLENFVSISVQVSAPVLTVMPAAITLTRFDAADRTDAVAFPVGTTQEELSKWFADSIAGFIGYDADGNSYDLISGAWSLEAVDTSKAFVYYASVPPDLGTEYTLADGVSLPRQRCAVSIQVPGEPDINCCVAGRGFLHFPWVLSAAQEEQLDKFSVWLRQDGGAWTSLREDFLSISDGLQLSQRIFKDGSTYDLKVAYPGGQTGVLTFQYDGELSILDYSSGDRDGGDVNGGGSGTGTQPAPTPPQTSSNSHDDDRHNHNDSKKVLDNSLPALHEPPLESTPVSEEPLPAALIPAVPFSLAKPVFRPEQMTVLSAEVNSDCFVLTGQSQGISQKQSNTKAADRSTPHAEAPTETDTISENTVPTVQEAYSPTQTVLSGLRLRDLCKEEESVVFGSGDVSVSIPSKLLVALNLSDTDTLTVTLTQPEVKQIVLSVEVSGKSVAQLSGTVLRLRYRPQSEHVEISVQKDAGEPMTAVSYDGELLRFAADEAGTYTILERSHMQEAKKGVSPLLPVSGGLLLAVGGITCLRRRCHG